jgi:formylglycine-generating enzyme required for sulfatase activity
LIVARATAVVVLCWLVLGGAAMAQPADPAPARVALVIGNARYEGAAPLPVADQARAAAEALRQGGFDVVLAENTTRTELALAIAEFSTRLRRDGLAVVFYAGQAVQARGRNLLVPVDAPSRSAQDVRDRAFDLDVLIDALIVSRPRSALILLDASRENPWQAAIDDKLKGLAPIEKMQAIAVAATAPPGRTVRADANVETGAVAEWLRAIATVNLDMTAALTRARNAAAKDARAHQPFWLSSPPPAGLVVTLPPRAPQVAQTTRAVISPVDPPGTSGQPDTYEISFWESIRSSENPAEYRAYLDAYPNGRFAALARAREQTYGKRGAPAVASATPPPAPARPQATPVAPAAPVAVAAPPASPPAPPPSSARTLRDCADCPEMALVPAGSFEMGSNEMFEFEKPVHAVTLKAAFYIGVNEVTFAQWDACVDQGGCQHRPNDRGAGRGERPVTDIHWDDANAYTAWLSVRTGRRYRLPSESEWEYAARAGSTTSYPWGRAVEVDKANCNGCNPQPRRQATPVGQFPANAFGLHDMAGNAAEWVADCWSENYRAKPRDGSAFSTPGCRERVLRGGSFNNDPRYLRSAARFKYESNVRFYTNGLRVVREP